LGVDGPTHGALGRRATTVAYLLVDGEKTVHAHALWVKDRDCAYDACYLATAEAVRAPLLTEDSRLLHAALGITRSLAPKTHDQG